MNKAASINEYINSFPPEIKILLEKMRTTIRQAAPGATEAISYGMPTFKLFGNLVHFAAFKNHVGLYPAPSGIEAFKKELAKYETGKGTLRFPLDEPLPLPLIKKIVAFRVEESTRKNASNKKKPVKKQCPKGHTFYKSSDCPVCPECEKSNKPADEFQSLISAPARRALQAKGINSLKILSGFTVKEILQLHGVGPAAIPVLTKALQNEGLSFKN